MNLKDLKNKKIALLGLGIENYVFLLYLLKNKVECEVTVCDMRSKEQLGQKYEKLSKEKNIKWKLVLVFNKDLGGFDILMRSPGWTLKCPGIREVVKKNNVILKEQRRLNNSVKGDKKQDSSPPAGGSRMTIIYSPMRLFMDLCPTRNIIGVTGTKGKGTTSSLIYEMIKENILSESNAKRDSHLPAGRHGAALQNDSEGRRDSLASLRSAQDDVERKVFLGGNIGVAPFAFLEEIGKEDYVVLELSSFQLEDMHKSPHIAVFTNFTKEHLAPADPNNPNFHKTMKEYWDAKANIFLHQKKEDLLVVNENLQSCLPADKVQITPVERVQANYDLKSKVRYFGKSNLESGLVGEHNKENVAAAVEVAKFIGINDKIVKKTVESFKGLEHRIEFVKKINVVRYYNDTFATTPEACITALKSFNSPIILIAGGADKGSDFEELAEEMVKRCDFIALLDGKGTERIKKELDKNKKLAKKVKIFYNIREAVKWSAEKAKPGDIVLLSPACASFGMFKNYKERGRLFKEEVEKLVK